MADETLYRIDGSVATLTLNRPEALNALSSGMISELLSHIRAASADDTVRAVVITGAGRAFCAGGDLKLAAETPGGVPAAFGDLAPAFHETVTEICRIEKPVIAAVNGIAAGGGFSLALSCDFRVMGRSSIMRQAYTSSGLSPDGGCTFHLPRLVGLARALELCAFDLPITADRALTWGLATRVVDDDLVVAESVAMATDLAGRSVHSFGRTKRLLAGSFETDIAVQLEREAVSITECAAHPDGQEGVRAFLEKRVPRFGENLR